MLVFAALVEAMILSRRSFGSRTSVANLIRRVPMLVPTEKSSFSRRFTGTAAVNDLAGRASVSSR